MSEDDYLGAMVLGARMALTEATCMLDVEKTATLQRNPGRGRGSTSAQGKADAAIVLGCADLVHGLNDDIRMLQHLDKPRTLPTYAQSEILRAALEKGVESRHPGTYTRHRWTPPALSSRTSSLVAAIKDPRSDRRWIDAQVWFAYAADRAATDPDLLPRLDADAARALDEVFGPTTWRGLFSMVPDYSANASATLALFDRYSVIWSRDASGRLFTHAPGRTRLAVDETDLPLSLQLLLLFLIDRNDFEIRHPS